MPRNEDVPRGGADGTSQAGPILFIAYHHHINPQPKASLSSSSSSSAMAPVKVSKICCSTSRDAYIR